MELRAHARGGLRLALAPLAVAAALAATTSPAIAAELELPRSDRRPPPGFELTANEVKEIARDTAAVREQKRLHEGLHPVAYTTTGKRWQVSWFDDDREYAQVLVGDSGGRVLEAWTGPQVAWRMARGYEGAFGRKFNAPYVWIPLGLLFLLPFVDPRRPFRLVHLDLLVLLGFGVSHVFFNAGRIGESVPLVYPVLLYLLARMLAAGFWPRERRERLVPLVPVAWLAIAALVLVSGRIALNVLDSNVIDVGFAGVIGADRIADGDELYGAGFSEEVGSGDTYGPANYLAYLPFEQALSWSGAWDALPAAHGAAIAFDLATMLGLLALGMRLRTGREGRELGAALGFAWAAYPYSLFALSSNANDSLVAALLVWALVAASAPAARGALVALATLTKFAPIALAPLFARRMDARPASRRARGAVGIWARVPPLLRFALAFVAVTTALVLAFVPDGGLRELYDRTVGYQAGRDSPFSLWGLQPELAWLQTGVKGAAIALALLVAILPRRRGPVQVAALAAAVLIALQLGVNHWFYLYVAWFAPLVLLAAFAPYRGGRAPPPAEMPRAREPAGAPQAADPLPA